MTSVPHPLLLGAALAAMAASPAVVRTCLQPDRDLPRRPQPAGRPRREDQDRRRDHRGHGGRQPPRLHRRRAEGARPDRHQRSGRAEARRSGPVDGEPTSVVIRGRKALVGVDTSPSKDKPSGHLAIVDLDRKAVDGDLRPAGPARLAGQGTPDGKFLAIAIENERDEEVNDGAIPQLPGGNLTIIGRTRRARSTAHADGGRPHRPCRRSRRRIPSPNSSTSTPRPGRA